MRLIWLGALGVIGLSALTLVSRQQDVSQVEALALERLSRADNGTPTARIVADLELIRRHKGIALASAATLVSFATETSPIYANRSKRDATGLYAYALLVAAEVTQDVQLLSRGVDLIVHGHKPYEVAAGARVVAITGRRVRWVEPYLRDALVRGIHDGPLSLDRYDSSFPDEECTSARVELVRALLAVEPDPLAAINALLMLHRQHTDGRGSHEPATPLQGEIERAVSILKTRVG